MTNGSVQVVDPVTGETLLRVAETSPAEVAEAVARARLAAPNWRARGFAERRAILTRMRGQLVDQLDELTTLICRETGRVEMDAVAVELLYTLEALRYWPAKAHKFLAERTVPLGLLKLKRGRIRYEPWPVVGIIAPWNFPLILTLGEAIPALMAGATVVIKPAPLTAASGDRIRSLAAAAGLPAGVLQVIHGDGPTAEALIAAVDYVAFTGSPATGRRVLTQAAQTLTPVSVELGGKDAMIVLDDADLERAASGAVWGAFFNSGQVCESVERLYVHERVAAPLTAAILTRTRALTQRSSAGAIADVGAMTSPEQLVIIERQVADAIVRGAKLLVGGRRREAGSPLYEPTVLTGVDHSMLVMREETFGPVLPIMTFTDDNAAIALANDSRYGLSASVWSRDVARATALARRVEAGSVCINDCLASYLAPELPFGGVKESGYARRHGGAEGIRKFCYTKSLFADRLGLRREPFWYPYHPAGPRIAKRLLRLLYGTTIRQRLRGLLGGD